MTQSDLKSKFPNMTPASRPPRPRRLNGCGVGLYGRATLIPKRERTSQHGAFRCCLFPSCVFGRIACASIYEWAMLKNADAKAADNIAAELRKRPRETVEQSIAGMLNPVTRTASGTYWLRNSASQTMANPPSKKWRPWESRSRSSPERLGRSGHSMLNGFRHTPGRSPSAPRSPNPSAARCVTTSAGATGDGGSCPRSGGRHPQRARIP